MKRFVAVIILMSLATVVLAADPPPKPKLILAITVDQFRYDYLTRFRAEYTGGLDQLLTRGAVFTNARYEHFPTVTAIGHSTFLSGATPAMSGIVGNDWYDRETGKQVSSVSDATVKVLGGTGDGGASPRRLLVSTIGDELKMASGGKSRAIGISFKDRSAILPVGHMADGAYWFDNRNGNFASSTFYFADLPQWVKEFNDSKSADRYRGAEWMGRKMPADAKLYSAVVASPFGNELIESFAERAIQAEQLGARDATDLLALSFSSNDYVGHALGPDSPEVRDMCIQTDRMLEKLFGYINSKIGMQNVLVVVTSDHGVAPMPEVNAGRRMPGGRMPGGIVQKTVEAALAKKYGDGKWISSPNEHSLYLNWELIQEKQLDNAEVARVAKEAALLIPHVFRVYTRDQLMNGNAMADQVGRRVMNGFYPRRGADVYVLLEPYWIFGASGTTHGTAFSYDSHVPVIFMGAGIRAGKFHQAIAVNDIAPTLATLLEVETPSGAVGRVLSEIFEEKTTFAGAK